ncbi:hypothetical protein GNI_079020 [Gregarina niphandrodes]|uniref:Uncharacterized protein n=1 Tax=Gregarina niphandrodes TaxID=110365 RepID=A0A023B6J3_GRENI|nr:hypothetical protein GNI_079020 [Gregarina niphandrodes]EZG66583.1 hypothetical protein GNI_079020 [Gregarina niphandrodes]|eukprot:XP_011130592.1 hypothetical protein GNI_079020 [Gregarina niphandrodes]
MLIGMVRKFDPNRLTICKQMGSRLSYSTIKYAALLMFGLSYNTEHKIHNIDLIRLTQYERLKCDVGDCYPLEHSLLPIQKLSDYVKNVVDKTPILVDDIPHSELGTAFEKLRSLAVSASGTGSEGPHDIWFTYNTNLFYLNAIVQQTMKGELSRKNLSLVWRVPGCQDPTTHWIAMFSSGFAFPVDLPATTLDYLDEKGDLTCNLQDLADGGPRETFVVHCRQQELNWESNQRLKELFRMKNGWTKLELYAWLSRCMLSSNSPSIDELISRYLRAVPGTPNAHENLMLHVEKFDPL